MAYTVGTIPVFLVPAQNPACTIHNVGPDIVYLGGADVVPGNGRALDIGAKLVWHTGGLWAVSDGTSSVNVYDGSGTEFDPKAIASQISLSPTRAAVQCGTITIDAANDVSSARVPVSQYAGVLLQLRSLSDTEANKRLGVRQITIDWFSDATSAASSGQRFTLECTGAYTELNLPVRDNYVAIRVWQSAFPGTVTYSVSGYSSRLELPLYSQEWEVLTNEDQYWSVIRGDGVAGAIWLKPASIGTTNSAYPLNLGGRSGRCQVTVEKCGASDAAFTLSVLGRFIDDSTVNAYPLCNYIISESGNQSSNGFVAPPGPIQLLYTRTGTSIQPKIALVWEQ